MAEYHVRLDKKDGKIKAGTLKGNGWNHNSDVTSEVLEAARDHLLFLSQKEGKDIAYTWQYENGMNIILKLEAQKSENIKDSSNE